MKLPIELIILFSITLAIIIYNPEYPLVALEDFFRWFSSKMRPKKNKLKDGLQQVEQNAPIDEHGQDDEVQKNPLHLKALEYAPTSRPVYLQDEITFFSGMKIFLSSKWQKELINDKLRSTEYTREDQQLYPSLLHMHFPHKVNKALRRAHILSLTQLLSLSHDELAAIKELGSEKLELIEYKLREEGLHLSPEDFEN